jgi:N-acetylmuramoyl-L-alanine amidase
MNKADFTVILGTAHLQTTPGKRSPDGSLREAVYSREIVSRVKADLEADGYNVVVDYEPLIPNTDIKAASSKAEQSRELAYRVNFVNAICKKVGAKKCLYMSIHVNAAGSGKNWMSAGGWCCYTSEGKTRADVLSAFLYDAAKLNFKAYEKIMEQGKKKGIYDKYQKPYRTDYSDGDADMEANFYVLRNTNCAACLSENFFQDNRSDVAFLLSEEGKDAIVRTHVEAIKNYVATI